MTWLFLSLSNPSAGLPVVRVLCIAVSVTWLYCGLEVSTSQTEHQPGLDTMHSVH